MNQKQENTISKKYQDNLGVEQAMYKAIQEALKKHKLAGNKVPVWNNGQVVYVEPEI